MKHIQSIVDTDVETLRLKDIQYGPSWKQRGGVGAYMMTVRKSDRIEHSVKPFNYDIFAAVAADKLASDGLIDDIRDLRCYLLLIEDYLIEEGFVAAPESGKPETATDAINDRPPPVDAADVAANRAYRLMPVGFAISNLLYLSLSLNNQTCFVEINDNWMKVGNAKLAQWIVSARSLQEEAMQLHEALKVGYGTETDDANENVGRCLDRLDFLENICIP